MRFIALTVGRWEDNISRFYLVLLNGLAYLFCVKNVFIVCLFVLSPLIDCIRFIFVLIFVPVNIWRSLVVVQIDCGTGCVLKTSKTFERLLLLNMAFCNNLNILYSTTLCLLLACKYLFHQCPFLHTWSPIYYSLRLIEIARHFLIFNASLLSCA